MSEYRLAIADFNISIWMNPTFTAASEKLDEAFCRLEEGGKRHPNPKEGENGDYLFPEINDPAFEEAMSSAIAEIIENRTENDDGSLE